MDDYERAKRNSHQVVARCAYSDCAIDHHRIRASIDLVRFWGPGYGDVTLRPVHAECFHRALMERQKHAVQTHDPLSAA